MVGFPTIPLIKGECMANTDNQTSRLNEVLGKIQIISLCKMEGS